MSSCFHHLNCFHFYPCCYLYEVSCCNKLPQILGLKQLTPTFPCSPTEWWAASSEATTTRLALHASILPISSGMNAISTRNWILSTAGRSSEVAPLPLKLPDDNTAQSILWLEPTRPQHRTRPGHIQILDPQKLWGDKHVLSSSACGYLLHSDS